MKKLFLAAAFFLLLLVVNPPPAFAGPECTSAGGACRGLCNLNLEEDLGPKDCPNQGSYGKCCRPKTTIPTCSSLGGTCKTKCLISEPASQGQLDCPQGISCCIPTANQKAGPECTDANGATGINTAIGCIPITDTNAFVGFILRWAIGIGGGIAFLLIIYAGFMIMTASGSPERLKAGQELLTSAIAGLIMLIFSVFILRIIGVNILGIFK